MKKCQICGKPATMFLTQIVNGQVTELAFCEECAKAKGLFDPKSLAFAEKFFPEQFKQRLDDLMRELVPGARGTQAAPQPTRTRSNMLTECPVCHFTLEDYRRTEHLGCPDCYRIFAQEIFAEHPEGASIIRQAASSPEENTAQSPALSIKQLEQQLRKAVEREDYETAAQLRDQIKKLS